MEIKGIWINKTPEPISVTVNGECYSGIIATSGHSPLMVMPLTGLNTLNVNITNRCEISSPVLLWLNDQVENPTIMQQTLRFGSWESLPVVATLVPTFYRFIIEEVDGGLLIVGTVELVDNEILAQAATR